MPILMSHENKKDAFPIFDVASEQKQRRPQHPSQTERKAQESESVNDESEHIFFKFLYKISDVLYRSFKQLENYSWTIKK